MTTSSITSWQTILGIRHNAPMRRALPLLLFVLLLSLIGCASKQVRLERRPKFYKSIISLSPSTTEIICSNGDLGTVKGRTAACDWPPNMVQPIPIVCNVKPDFEKIAAIKPDLIVYDKDLINDQDIAKLKSTGADFYGIDALTIKDFVKQLYELGSMVGFETRFNDYIIRIETDRSSVSALPFSSVPKVAIVMPGPTGNDYICSTDGFLGDVVKNCGGQLVGPKGTQFVAMNPEQFVALDPDVILVGGSKQDTSGPGLILGDARFKTIKAVKDQHVEALLSDVLFRRGQRVDELIKAIHSAISPKKN